MSVDFELGNLYKWTFSFKELFYKFFKKKKCPICDNKLKHYSESNFVGYEHINRASSKVATLFDNEVKTYAVTSNYYCNNCNIFFTLTELAEGVYEE